jgi:hypothetical protein
MIKLIFSFAQSYTTFFFFFCGQKLLLNFVFVYFDNTIASLG